MSTSGASLTRPGAPRARAQDDGLAVLMRASCGLPEPRADHRPARQRRGHSVRISYARQSVCTRLQRETCSVRRSEVIFAGTISKALLRTRTADPLLTIAIRG